MDGVEFSMRPGCIPEFTLTLVLEVSLVNVLGSLGLHEVKLTGKVDEVGGQVGVINAVLKILVLCFDKDLLSGKHKSKLLLQETSMSQTSQMQQNGENIYVNHTIQCRIECENPEKERDLKQTYGS